MHPNTARTLPLAPQDLTAAAPVLHMAGLPIARLSMAETADLMIETASLPRAGRPLFLTSANGEVMSRCASDEELAQLFLQADLISADGQPMVLASRLFSRTPLPERVATTDLFHDVARLAAERGLSFYMFGATPEENEKAVENVRAAYPDLDIVGHSHGYLSYGEMLTKVKEINGLAPDILWVALGVPHEQRFVQAFSSHLSAVGVIKTSGGLFNFLSGSRARAPRWMQKAGLEWAWRLWLEPRRLFWRYAVTTPHALYLMVTGMKRLHTEGSTCSRTRQ